MDSYKDHAGYPSAVTEKVLYPPREYEGDRVEDAAAPKWAYVFIKRLLDILLSLVGLLILSPLFLVVAILIKREDGGPVIYRSYRVGRKGKSIGVFKFRSMKPHADRLEDMLTPEELAEYRKEFKLAHDPRVTRMGSFLRKTSIDELPQLVNILSGDMSIVGPRPLVRNEVEGKYTASQRVRLLSVRPGLTGLWQVSGRSDCTYESGERQKLELSYIDRRSLLLDFKVILRTIAVVLKRDGAR